MSEDALAAPRLYLVTYRPLVMTAHGRQASERLDIPPFVDGSIRREPDLENDPPTISALCRGAMFAPRLRVGDVAVYLTVKGRWGHGRSAHRRLTAVLRVAEKFESHAEAARWFRDAGRSLPSNCMVPENPPEPLTHSIGLSRRRACGTAQEGCQNWDKHYRDRTRRHGAFLISDALFVDVSWSAPRIEDEDLVQVFGCVPATRTPHAHPREEVETLLHDAGVRVQLPKVDL